MADEGELAIQTQQIVGAFVLRGTALAAVCPGTAVDAARMEMICGAFVLGPERTRQQDTELGVRQLADIAIKALSPAINDPTTATLCVDRLAQVLVRASSLPTNALFRGTRGGRVIARQPPFTQLVDVAFTQIRRYGAGDPIVGEHLISALGGIAARVGIEQREPLCRQAQALLTEARQQLAVPGDLERVEAAAYWCRDACVSAR